MGRRLEVRHTLVQSHITSGITIELIFVIIFGIAVVLYFLMMRRSEEGVAPKWCAILAIVVSVAPCRRWPRRRPRSRWPRTPCR